MYASNIECKNILPSERGMAYKIKLDAYPKILLANTHYDEYQYEGIRIVDVADWLAAD